MAGAIYGVWALMTVMHSTDRFRDRIRNLDLLTIVPEWRFFGENPGRVDFHLLYRDRLVSDEITDWIELPLIVRRPWNAFVFYPGRRPAKALMDVVIHASRVAKEHGESISGSLPYLALLHHVSAQPAGEGSTHRQFLILQTTADRDDAEPELVIASEMHELDSVTGP